MPSIPIVQAGGGAAQDTNNDGSVTGGSATFDQDNTANNTIIILGGASSPKGTSIPTGLAATDTQGNTYNVAQAAPALGTDGSSCIILYANGIKAGTEYGLGSRAAGSGMVLRLYDSRTSGNLEARSGSVGRRLEFDRHRRRASD